jgi:hypothetical protein
VLVGPAFGILPEGPFFNACNIELAVVTVHLTIGRARYKAWRVRSPYFYFIDYLYFRGTYPSHFRRSGKAIDVLSQA